ncbi:MAG: UDP-4-amino-4,6-dideoxy-N-acetyl-beta-L-altrosamine transaminase [Betaproteobacteria bacterium]
MIPYGRQDIGDDDIAAVVEVLKSDWLTTGPAIDRFEQHVAARCGAAHAAAVSNGTVALHIACRALGLGPGDTLWTSPNTFVASANCARYCGAEVDFVDIDPRTYNMDAGLLEKKLKQGKPPKIVVPVHFAGQPCDMEAIGALARRYGFALIEDASHAIGATYKGEPVGNCRHSDITVLSFHPVKIVTTAEGGMTLTNRTELAGRLAILRTHGITRDPTRMEKGSQGPWYYEQVDLGYNYRMTDLQAALGSAQLRRIDEFLARRRALAARYDKLLADLPVTRPWQHAEGVSAWHLYVIHVRAERRRVFDALRAHGVGANVHYIPVHLQPYYRALGFKAGDFPYAEAYYAGAITLPLFPRMTDADQDRVVDALAKALG